MKYLLILPCLFSVLLSTAQIRQSQRLGIGDSVPNLKISDIVNYRKINSSISDFRGKLLILDFWATWCAPCVANLLKNDSLEKKFGNELEIMPVSSESREIVYPFLNQFKAVTHVLPPSITNDTILSKYFYHTVLPHYVWISKDGKVIGYTEAEDVNGENISKIIKGQKVELKLKNDAERPINTERQFISPFGQDKTGSSFEISSSKDPKYFHSIITGYIPNVHGFAHWENTRLTIVNATIGNIYTTCFLGRDIGLYDQPIWLIDPKDSFLYMSKLSGQKYVTWSKDHVHSFELTLPLSMANHKNEIAQQEINRYFGIIYGIEGNIEEQTTSCYVLIRTTENDLLKSVSGNDQVKINRFSLILHNKPIKELISIIRKYQQNTQKPFLDETGYSGNIDISVNCDLGDMNSVNEGLSKFGLKFVQAERKIKRLVIRDKNNKKK